jgi:ribosomal protein L11 methyltransferase
LKWLEISLTLTGELAEAAAEVISRYTPNSIAMEYPLEGDQIDPTAQVVLHAYLENGPPLEETRSAIEAGLWHLSQIEPFDPPSFKWIEQDRWEDAWKDHYQPIKIGERLLIQPAWLPIKSLDRIPILIDPGMAFGTGTHPSTQLCLLALEKHLQPGQAVVDLGCGSGILSVAAAKLDASEVLAVDIDASVIKYAQENIAANDVGAKIKLAHGSLEVVQANYVAGESEIDLLLANILANVLLDLLNEGLGNSIRPHGILILSGILDHQAEEVIQAAQKKNLEHLETGKSDDWRSLIFKRKSPR